MELAEAVMTRLRAVGAVTAIVGTGDAARIHWNVRPQGETLPALVLVQAGGEPDDLDLAGNADFQESRIQGTCLARSYMEARALAKAFSDALVSATEVSGFLFWEADRERPIDLGFDAVAGGGFIHEVTQDVILRHSLSA